MSNHQKEAEAAKIEAPAQSEDSEDKEIDILDALKQTLIEMCGEDGLSIVTSPDSGDELGYIFIYRTSDDHEISFYATAVSDQIIITGTAIYNGLFDFLKSPTNKLAIYEKLNAWNNALYDGAFSMRTTQSLAAVCVTRYFVADGIDIEFLQSSLENNINRVVGAFITLVTPFMLLLPETRSQAVNAGDYIFLARPTKHMPC